MTACPVCGVDRSIATVVRDQLPTMQNHVYRTREQARAAKRGVLTLAVCSACGFSRNGTFDPSLLEYDDEYDNTVPSSVMADYYAEIAGYLGRQYNLADGFVVDIGCGNGAFLKALARIWPRCHGVGVDPALAGDEVHADGRIRLVKGVFHEEQLARAPSLFVCRHVLEHIPAPVSFVRELRTALGDRLDVPLFVEVPDLQWIVDHHAFWDFCYEHCNYFTAGSLGQVLSSAGFRPTATRVAFGGQYRWMEAVAAPLAAEAFDETQGRTFARRLAEYAAGEQSNIAAIRARLCALKAAGGAIAIWGMATKGVVFSLLVDGDHALIDAAVDVNVNKQGCYVPLSGRVIDPPSVLLRQARPLSIVVMNTNYLEEIKRTCASMSLQPGFLDAAGREV